MKQLKKPIIELTSAQANTKIKVFVDKISMLMKSKTDIGHTYVFTEAGVVPVYESEEEILDKLKKVCDIILERE